ncbi:MAG: PAS domain S-box protein [Bacteroidales bacterium]
MKKWILASFCVLLLSPARSNIDSLYAVLGSAADDSVRSEVNWQLAALLMDRHDYELAEYHLKQSIDQLQHFAGSPRLSQRMVSLSGLLIRRGLYQEARESAMLAAHIADESNDLLVKGKALLNAAIALKETNRDSLSLQFFQQAYHIFADFNDSLLIACACNGLGTVYKELENYDEALKYYRRSLDLKKALGADAAVINSLGNIGNVLVARQKYDTALQVFDEVIRLSHIRNDAYARAATLSNMADVFLEQNRPETALTAIDSGLSISTQNRYFDLSRDLYRKLSDFYAARNNYRQAFGYQQKIQAMKDSLNEIRTDDLLAELKRMQQINAMQQEINRVVSQTSGYKLMYIVIFVLISLVAIYSYIRNIKLRKARNAYRASERKYRMLAENANEVVWSADLNMNLVYISPSTENLFGYPRHVRKKIPLSDIITPESYDMLQRKLHEKIAAYKKSGKVGEPVTMEIKGIHREGHTVWVELLANLTTDEDGALTGVQGVSRNITARKIAELKMLELIENLRLQDEELRLQNEKIQLARMEVERRARQYFDLFENSPVGYLVLDASATIRQLNSAAEKILGHSKSALIESSFTGYVVEKERETFVGLLHKTLELQKKHEKECEISSINARVVFVPELVESESFVRIAIIDISTEKQTRDKLSEALQLMSSVFDAIPGGISVVDRHYNVIILNSRLQKINNVSSKNEVIGRKCYQVYRCEDKPCESCSLTRVLKTGQTVIRQTIPREELLTGSPHRIYSSPIFSESGEITGMVEAVMDISDLVKVEEALKESEKKFEELFNEIPDAIFITRLGPEHSGDIVAVNPAAEKQTGYSAAELTGMNLLRDIVCCRESDQELTDRRENNLVASKKVELIEQKRRKDGSMVWTEVLIQKICINNKDMALSVSRDITDRRRAEENLRLSETRIRSLIDALPDLLFIFDGEGRFLDYHAHDPGKLLVKPEVFMNRPIMEVLPEYIAKVTLKHIRLAMETGKMQVFEYSVKTPKGVAYHESRMVKSRENEVLTVVRDITEPKMTELELRKSEEKYRTIFTNSPVGIFNFDENGIILDCNQNFVDIIGSSREMLVGFDILKKVSDQKLVTAIRAAIQTGSGYYEDYYKSVTAAKVTPVKAFLQAIRDSRGDLIHGVGIVEDITGQKKYEDQLLLAKKKAEESDKLKSSFMAIMSHELRTPLNSIIGFSEMLEYGIPEDQVQETAELITRSGKHLLAIIENIFDISLIDSGDVKIAIENFTLQRLMDSLQTLAGKTSVQLKKQHLDIVIQMPENLKELRVCTDIQKMFKIFSHLIHNALKFTRKGGIEIGIREENVSGITDNILFYVKDTGIGIEKEKHRLIFQLFRQADETSTREFEGTGLGLSIAKRLIELLGGEIWLDSTPGEGSVFYFELPCFKSTHEAVEFLYKKSGTEIRSRDSKTIVIAEDDDSNFQLFELLLKRKKMNVIRAYNGREAVEHVERMPDINLVLMDINMPVMNGYQATREIKKLRKNLPVIAVTAYAMAGDEYKANQAGCDDYLTKPINNKLFYQTVYKYIS